MTNGIAALVQWSRAVLADHGASCVCTGCQALARAEGELVAMRDARPVSLPATPDEPWLLAQPRQERLL